MVDKAISFDIRGIKCDAKGCGWRDDLAEFDPDKYLNAPCPSCGSNLFTPADYKAMKRMFRVASLINKIAAPFIRKSKDKRKIAIPCNMDGSGKIKLERTPNDQTR